MSERCDSITELKHDCNTEDVGGMTNIGELKHNQYVRLRFGVVFYALRMSTDDCYPNTVSQKQ